MAVETLPRRSDHHRVVNGLALAAPVLDIVGRVLAPSLLLVWPLAIVAMSPTDPHMLLARFDPGALLVSVVFVARFGRAWVIYAAIKRGAFRLRSDRLRRLLLPTERARRGRGAAMVAVVLLPGMLAGVVGGRAGLRTRDFAAALLVSTGAGLTITLVTASRFRTQIHAASVLVTSHPVEATLAVVVIITVGMVRRLRGRDREVNI